MDIWTQYEKYRNDLTYTAKDGEAIKLCVGLSASFYFWHGETQETRFAVARCFERFQDLFGERLVWVLPDESISRRAVRIDSQKAVPTLREYVATMDADDQLSWSISAAPSTNEAADCYITVLGIREWEIKVRNPLSRLSFAMPIDAVYGPEGNPALFVEFIRFCCEQLRPWSGIAGLASSFPHNRHDVQAAEFELQQRYFGLDTVASGFFLVDNLQQNLKGANWLTMFDEGFPVTFTRAQWDTLAATPGIQLWKSGYTYVLQAGDQPTLGPVPDGIPLPYQAISTAIKPMRITPMPSFHTGSMTGEILFNGRTSELWSQRFDAPGIWPPYPDRINYHEVDTSIDEYASEPIVEPMRQPPAVPPRRFLRAMPGEKCPQAGDWFSPNLSNKTVRMTAGEPMPGPAGGPTGSVIWYMEVKE